LNKFLSSLVTTALVTVGLLATQAAPAPAAMYFGATISGEPYGQTGTAPFNISAWDLFERHAGKKVAILNQSQEWLTFDNAEMDATRARGAIPLVTMGLAEGVTIEGVAAGSEDAAIRSWARAAKAWGHPFFFAPWWEMNGGWFPWGRNPKFVEAWRHFHDLVVAEGATNVTWSWVTNDIWYDPLSDPEPFYPGDAYVDWTGIDGYNWGHNPAQTNRWMTPDEVLTPTLERIAEFAPSKPVMILENASTEYGGNKTDWISELLGTYLPHHPEIKAYLWFNWNFRKAGGLRSDWPIETSAPAQQAFRNGIQSSLYRSTAPTMANLTKVPVPPPASGGEGPHAADLSPSSENATSPQVAVSADGAATVVWSAQEGGNFGVYARTISPIGVPGAIQGLSAPLQDALSPQVAVAPDGTATVVWIRSNGSYFVVQERRILPDGTLEPTKDLSATGRNSGEPQVAVAADGTATVVWKRFDGGADFLIKERRIEPDGTLAEETGNTLSATGQNAVEPQVAAGPDGSATVVWERFDEANTIVQERRIEPDGTPASTVNDLSEAGQNAVQPDIVVGADGVATVVWARSDGSNTVVQENRLSASGVPDATVNALSAAGGNAAEPHVALAPDGTATVVWDRFDGSNFVVQARRVTPAGSLEATVTLSGSGRDAAEPRVAVAPGGGATVAWTRFDGTNFVAQRRELAANGVLAAATDSLSAAGHGAGGAQVTAGGGLKAVWLRYDGAHDVVQAQTAPRPVVELTPDSLDFGAVQVGSGGTPDHVFELTNSGSAPLAVSSIATGGAGAAQFDLSGTGSCIGASLAPGAACKFSAAFEPSRAGSQAATIEVLSNAPSSPDAASLFGTAVAPTSAQAVAAASKPRAASQIRVDNAFAIGKAILNKRKGTARLPVAVPGPGTLIAVGAGTSTVPVSARETVKLRVRAHGRKLRALNRSGTATLRLTVTFIPVGGAPSSQIVKLRLRKTL
jgi:hypothetical protein